MNTAFKGCGWALVLSMSGGAVMAQDPPPAPPAAAPAKTPAKSTPQSDAGEPRANTSVPAAAGPSSAASTGAAAAPGGAAGAPTSPRSTPKAGAPRPAAGPAKGGTDRLDLGTATVTGDREQPKVMYIVPWKRSDIGDGSGKPMNSLLDEALAPVDRDEFKREVVYYNAVKADAPQSGASNPAKQGEK
jgi:hypothetical protein